MSFGARWKGEAIQALSVSISICALLTVYVVVFMVKGANCLQCPVGQFMQIARVWFRKSNRWQQSGCGHSSLFRRSTCKRCIMVIWNIYAQFIHMSYCWKVTGISDYNTKHPENDIKMVNSHWQLTVRTTFIQRKKHSLYLGISTRLRQLHKEGWQP